MNKSKYANMIVLGMVLTVSSSGVVYANASKAISKEGQSYISLSKTVIEQSSPNTTVASAVQTKSAENPEILQKQREIDQYVFEKHKDEIARKGFKVTHTGPQDNFVEIGIEPFNEDNAEYIYTIFGKDMVKVVEGQQAYTLGLAPAKNEVAPQVQASAEVALGDKSKTEAGGTSILGALVYTLSVVVILGVAAAALKRIVPIGKR